MAIGDIFFGSEITPSAFQIATEDRYLRNEDRKESETLGFSEQIRNILGFKTDDTGALKWITDQERFDALDHTEKDVFRSFEQQAERLQRAFNGDLPVSEALAQRSEDQFKILQEERSRRGGVVSGTNLETAQGYDTPSIQTIGQAQRTQGLLEDKERRDELNSGFSNLSSSAGLLAGLRDKNFLNMANAPKRFGSGDGGGLLGSSNAANLFNAEQERKGWSGIGGLLGDLAKTGFAEWIK